MAEAYLKNLGGSRFAPESAGLEPGVLNPLAVAVMKEDGIDISANTTKDVFSLLHQGKSFSYVITVCDAKNAERCPVFPGMHKKLNWDFADPSAFSGSYHDKLIQTRKIRDEIKAGVINFISSFPSHSQLS